MNRRRWRKAFTQAWKMANVLREQSQARVVRKLDYSQCYALSVEWRAEAFRFATKLAGGAR